MRVFFTIWLLVFIRFNCAFSQTHDIRIIETFALPSSLKDTNISYENKPVIFFFDRESTLKKINELYSQYQETDERKSLNELKTYLVVHKNQIRFTDIWLNPDNKDLNTEGINTDPFLHCSWIFGEIICDLLKDKNVMIYDKEKKQFIKIIKFASISYSDEFSATSFHGYLTCDETEILKCSDVIHEDFMIPEDSK